MTDLSDSMQHVEFHPGMIVHYARCESCTWDSHYEEPTRHSWASEDDFGPDEERNARILTQKCHCDCAGPLDHPHGDAA